MGQRRMFSLTVINSARFIKLPIDAQNLYFHLGMRADDDGIVEAFPVMRMIGSSEDNLKLLHAKDFVRVLNEDFVTYITDWHEHNTIRADRKVDSIYRGLLIQLLPEAKITEPKPRSDVKNNSKRLGNGQSTDSPRTGNGRHKLSKDKLSKDKETYMDVVELTKDEYQKLIERYGEKETLDKIENLALYIKSKGAKYKCHYSTILCWERKNKKDTTQSTAKERYPNIKL